jgi:hypothetical protein
MSVDYAERITVVNFCCQRLSRSLRDHRILESMLVVSILENLELRDHKNRHRIHPIDNVSSGYQMPKGEEFQIVLILAETGATLELYAVEEALMTKLEKEMNSLASLSILKGPTTLPTALDSKSPSVGVGRLLHLP